MPIVTIETLSDEPSSAGDSLPDPEQLQRLADVLGELFGSGPSGTWVRARQQQRAFYAENLVEVDQAMRPVIVEILKSQLGTEQERAAEAEAVCMLVAEILDRNTDNVHIIFQPEARGRIAFGGKLVH